MRKIATSFAAIAIMVAGLASPSAAIDRSATEPPIGTMALVPIFGRPLPVIGKFIPLHTRGDREYKGHGPAVTAHAVLLGLGTDQLFVRLFMKAEETKSDWTTAQGHSQLFTIFVAPAGQCIHSVTVGTFDGISYTDTDHAEDAFGGQVMNSFVDGYAFIGDTSGNEAGTETGMSILTKTFTADVRPC